MLKCKCFKLLLQVYLMLYNLQCNGVCHNYIFLSFKTKKIYQKLLLFSIISIMLHVATLLENLKNNKCKFWEICFENVTYQTGIWIICSKDKLSAIERQNKLISLFRCKSNFAHKECCVVNFIQTYILLSKHSDIFKLNSVQQNDNYRFKVIFFADKINY